MDNYKFRVYDANIGNMLQVQKLDIENEVAIVNTKSYSEEIKEVYSLDNVDLMRYTGYTTSEREDIYEGDIVNIHVFTVRYSGSLGSYEVEKEFKNVVIEEEYGCLGFFSRENESWVNFSDLEMYYEVHKESFKLIGNIYTNREIIKGDDFRDY